MATKTSDTNASSSVIKDPKKIMTEGNTAIQESEMKDTSLHKFFITTLKDIYFAESEIVDALEKMQSAATTEELKEAFEDHQFQTKKQIKRLEKIFQLLDEKPEKKRMCSNQRNYKGRRRNYKSH